MTPAVRSVETAESVESVDRAREAVVAVDLTASAAMADARGELDVDSAETRRWARPVPVTLASRSKKSDCL